MCERVHNVLLFVPVQRKRGNGKEVEDQEEDEKEEEEKVAESSFPPPPSSIPSQEKEKVRLLT